MEKNRVEAGCCPQCNGRLILNSEELELPYFRGFLVMTLTCPVCNYRYSDTFSLQEQSPMRHVLRVKEEKDLDVRVVRSGSSSIRLPELGVLVEPGPACEAFVSNVEGVLNRVKCVIEMAGKWGGEEEAAAARRLLDKIEMVKRGKEEITLIIEDPLGNSAIISQKARKEELTLPSPEDID